MESFEPSILFAFKNVVSQYYGKKHNIYNKKL